MNFSCFLLLVAATVGDSAGRSTASEEPVVAASLDSKHSFKNDTLHEAASKRSGEEERGFQRLLAKIRGAQQSETKGLKQLVESSYPITFKQELGLIAQLALSTERIKVAKSTKPAGRLATSVHPVNGESDEKLVKQLATIGAPIDGKSDTEFIKRLSTSDPPMDGASDAEFLKYGIIDQFVRASKEATASLHTSKIGAVFHELGLDAFKVPEKLGPKNELVVEFFSSNKFRAWLWYVSRVHPEDEWITYLANVYTNKILATFILELRGTRRGDDVARLLEGALFDSWYYHKLSPSELAGDILGLKDGITSKPFPEWNIVDHYSKYRYQTHHKKEDQEDGW
ncbi:unnamed protein product [Hyaloperonospora brassicae]|uniref:RxLR effector candidate protein n=1 Tax=Hyaloperonospora brassicae TaxID=162125 RepID=A0AAV0TWV5_HYABA|nr:unnamed protein product [Hyaloperonospora brassicae]